MGTKQEGVAKRPEELANLLARLSPSSYPYFEQALARYARSHQGDAPALAIAKWLRVQAEFAVRLRFRRRAQADDVWSWLTLKNQRVARENARLGEPAELRREDGKARLAALLDAIGAALAEPMAETETPATGGAIVFSLPSAAVSYALPPALDRRLQELLDKQDRGGELTTEERAEAEGLVDVADQLSLLRSIATAGRPEDAA